jgi:DNA polymerase-1
MDDENKAWEAIKVLLEDPRVGIVGHNVISDGHWLLSQGIDIRPRVVWDTMLAEFVLNETGPWDLGEVALKYTRHGRYAAALEMWFKEHQDECAHGYGPIPEELLLPYGAIDVDAPRQIAEKQFEIIVRDYPGFLKPRGINGEYPSLWDTTLRTQQLIYELERTGMLVDLERLNSMIEAYQQVRSNLLGLITTEAAVLGVTDFSPTSVQDVQKLLFKTLKLAPVKTTGGKEWAEYVGNQGLDNTTENSPSTDQTTLEILQDAHPIVRHILYFRRIDQICKTLLRYPKEGEDEVSKGGGLIAKIWPDGRIHAHLSQLAETSRFRASKPNVQNFPKKAEGYMLEIFGSKEKLPPPIRSVIIPGNGCVFVEGDFVQAELFVLAGLSGDMGMMDALRTPGRDLHDITAISAFKLRVVDDAGRDVPESVLIDLAAANKGKGGANSKEFKSYVKTLRYIDLKGKTMTREEFKETIRVSAKNLNFGIP